MSLLPSDPLALLLSARRVGYIFSGGSARCAFQVGVIETLRELGARPGLCIGVSVGAWNAAAVAAGSDARLRHYWRTYVRMPPVDLRNLLRDERSPFLFTEAHRRTFPRYVGAARLRRPEAPPLYVGLTRLRDRRPVLFDASEVDDPLALLLASNYLPPFYTRPPRLGGEAYADGAFSDNIPYERAFAEGCDAVVLMNMRGESEGGLRRNASAPEHAIPEDLRGRCVVIRPRHRLPLGFVERRWPVLRHVFEVGRLRAREVLLGESHPETHLRAEGEAPTARLARLLARARPGRN